MAWLSEFDSSRLDDVPSTTGYRDILPSLLASPSLMMGEIYQLTFINKNNSCHMDAMLELLYTLAIWLPSVSILRAPSSGVGGFRIAPALADAVSACFKAQEATMRIEAADANAAMTLARDACLRALSPITGTSLGRIGSCLSDLYFAIEYSGPEEGRCTFPLIGQCPNGAAVQLGGKSGRFNLDGGFYFDVTVAHMRRFCFSRSEDLFRSICPFDVVTSVFSGKTAVRTCSKACHCRACRGDTVTIDCFVDSDLLDRDYDGSILPVPPPFLIVECRDLDKSFNDTESSPFSHPRPLKKLVRVEGYLPFGPLGAHYTLIGVARHLGPTSTGGHWNCDVNLPRAGGWFHAENLAGQSTSMTSFKDDRSCCGYLWVKDDK